MPRHGQSSMGAAPVLRKSQLLGILVTILCLGLAFYRVDLRGLLDALAAGNYVLVAPAALCTLSGYLLRTARWRVILAEAVSCSFGTLFGILMVGFAANNLLPARLGELARAYLLRRRSGVRKSYLLASIFVERVFDGLVLVALLGGVSLVVDLPGWGREVEVLGGGLFVAVAIGVAAVMLHPELFERVMSWTLKPFPTRMAHWTAGAFGAFLTGLNTMRRPGVLARTVLLSIAVWSLEWSSYFILSNAFQLGLSTGQRPAACCWRLSTSALCCRRRRATLGRSSSSRWPPFRYSASGRKWRSPWRSWRTSPSTCWSPRSGWLSSDASTCLGETCQPTRGTRLRSSRSRAAWHAEGALPGGARDQRAAPGPVSALCRRLGHGGL